MATLIFFSFSALLLLISIQLFRNKWLLLIAGYNTLTREEREKFNIRPYAIAVSRFMAATSLLVFVYGIDTLNLNILNKYILIAYVIAWMLFIWTFLRMLKLVFKK